MQQHLDSGSCSAWQRSCQPGEPLRASTCESRAVAPAFRGARAAAAIAPDRPVHDASMAMHACMGQHDTVQRSQQRSWSLTRRLVPLRAVAVLLLLLLQPVACQPQPQQRDGVIDTAFNILSEPFPTGPGPGAAVVGNLVFQRALMYPVPSFLPAYFRAPPGPGGGLLIVNSSIYTLCATLQAYVQYVQVNAPRSFTVIPELRPGLFTSALRMNSFTSSYLGNTITLNNVTLSCYAAPDFNSAVAVVNTGSELESAVSFITTLRMRGTIRVNSSLSTAAWSRTTYTPAAGLTFSGPRDRTVVLDFGMTAFIVSMTTFPVYMENLVLVNLCSQLVPMPVPAFFAYLAYLVFAFTHTTWNTANMYLTNVTMLVPSAEIDVHSFWFSMLQAGDAFPLFNDTYVQPFSVSYHSLPTVAVPDEATIRMVNFSAVNMQYRNVTLVSSDSPFAPMPFMAAAATQCMYGQRNATPMLSQTQLVTPGLAPLYRVLAPEELPGQAHAWAAFTHPPSGTDAAVQVGPDGEVEVETEGLMYIAPALLLHSNTSLSLMVTVTVPPEPDRGGSPGGGGGGGVNGGVGTTGGEGSGGPGTTDVAGGVTVSPASVGAPGSVTVSPDAINGSPHIAVVGGVGTAGADGLAGSGGESPRLPEEGRGDGSNSGNSGSNSGIGGNSDGNTTTGSAGSSSSSQAVRRSLEADAGVNANSTRANASAGTASPGSPAAAAAGEGLPLVATGVVEPPPAAAAAAGGDGGVPGAASGEGLPLVATGVVEPPPATAAAGDGSVPGAASGDGLPLVATGVVEPPPADSWALQVELQEETGMAAGSYMQPMVIKRDALIMGPICDAAATPPRMLRLGPGLGPPRPGQGPPPFDDMPVVGDPCNVVLDLAYLHAAFLLPSNVSSVLYLQRLTLMRLPDGDGTDGDEDNIPSYNATWLGVNSTTPRDGWKTNGNASRPAGLGPLGPNATSNASAAGGLNSSAPGGSNSSVKLADPVGELPLPRNPILLWSFAFERPRVPDITREREARVMLDRVTIMLRPASFAPLFALASNGGLRRLDAARAEFPNNTALFDPVIDGITTFRVTKINSSGLYVGVFAGWGVLGTDIVIKSTEGTPELPFPDPRLRIPPPPPPTPSPDKGGFATSSPPIPISSPPGKQRDGQAPVTPLGTAAASAETGLSQGSTVAIAVCVAVAAVAAAIGGVFWYLGERRRQQRYSIGCDLEPGHKGPAAAPAAPKPAEPSAHRDASGRGPLQGRRGTETSGDTVTSDTAELGLCGSAAAGERAAGDELKGDATAAAAAAAAVTALSSRDRGSAGTAGDRSSFGLSGGHARGSAGVGSGARLPQGSGSGSGTGAGAAGAVPEGGSTHGASGSTHGANGGSAQGSVPQSLAHASGATAVPSAPGHSLPTPSGPSGTTTEASTSGPVPRLALAHSNSMGFRDPLQAVLQIASTVSGADPAGAAPLGFGLGLGDRLELLELIGTGGFGTVYHGRWRNLDVAVKTVLFTNNGSGARTTAEAAIREAAVCSSVVHPYVVSTYYYDIKSVELEGKTSSGGLKIDSQSCGTDWKLFLVQELCEANLADVIEASMIHDHATGMPKLPLVLTILSQVADGMQYIHSKSIIHGDLKPENVLLKHDAASPPPCVVSKITDFGLCTTMDPGKTHISGFTNGTPFYMAPEVALSRKGTHSSDVYSFGVLMVEVYTGSPPWVRNGDGYAANRNFLKFKPGTPRRFAQLAMRCLDPKPRLRPTFAEVAAALHDMRACLRAGFATLERPVRDAHHAHGHGHPYGHVNVHSVSASGSGLGHAAHAAGPSHLRPPMPGQRPSQGQGQGQVGAQPVPHTQQTQQQGQSSVVREQQQGQGGQQEPQGNSEGQSAPGPPPAIAAAAAQGAAPAVGDRVAGQAGATPRPQVFPATVAGEEGEQRSGAEAQVGPSSHGASGGPVAAAAAASEGAGAATPVAAQPATPSGRNDTGQGGGTTVTRPHSVATAGAAHGPTVNAPPSGSASPRGPHQILEVIEPVDQMPAGPLKLLAHGPDHATTLGSGSEHGYAPSHVHGFGHGHGIGTVDVALLGPDSGSGSELDVARPLTREALVSVRGSRHQAGVAAREQQRQQRQQQRLWGPGAEHGVESEDGDGIGLQHVLGCDSDDETGGRGSMSTDSPVGMRH